MSRGNMANFTAFLAGRTAKAPKHLKEDGLTHSTEKLRVYCAKTTYTWIEKVAMLLGLSYKAIRWIETDENNKMNIEKLDETIRNHLARDCLPIIMMGTGVM